MLAWFKSYLSERKQQVKINNFIPNIIEVTSGVLQGNHLSPILFNIFINDLQYVFTNCKILLFTDNWKLYLSINSINDCNKLQNYLIQFKNWCQKNLLHINISKCSQITFTKYKKPITLLKMIA
jgi:hypothetical protein